VRAVRLAALALVVVALAACGGDGSSEPASRTDPATGPGGAAGTATAPDPVSAANATAYVRSMKGPVVELGRLLRGADLRRNRRDFDRGVALLRVRRQLARITAQPALLLAHDALAKAVARAGTLLVAAPGSEVAIASRRSGLPAGTQTAVGMVGHGVTMWAGDADAKLRELGEPVPRWLDREARSARRLALRATERLR
jgi:hypothetical protein